MAYGKSKKIGGRMRCIQSMIACKQGDKVTKCVLEYGSSAQIDGNVVVVGDEAGVDDALKF